MKTVTVRAQVTLTIDIPDGEYVTDVLNELEYSFSSDTATVGDYHIQDFVVVSTVDQPVDML